MSQMITTSHHDLHWHRRVAYRTRVPRVTCRCQPYHRGRPIDVASLNIDEVPAQGRTPYRFVIVPGYTPRLGWRAGLHPKNIVRLEGALAALSSGLACAVIVSGAAVHSPDNEAILMRDWLNDRGVD